MFALENPRRRVIIGFMFFRWIPVLLSSWAISGCTSGPELQTVQSVDLSRYAGQWHEIESFPHWFQRGCTNSLARYTPLSDGKIEVVNTCQKNGRTTSIRGVARVVPGSNNSKLKVRFFGPFEGDYWILDLDPNYRWVAVGHPNRQYLWILARTPDLDETTLRGIRERLRQQGFDTNRLIKTVSPTP